MKNLILCAIFFSITANADSEVLSPIEVPKSLRQKLNSFEPSAGIFLPDFGKYLIASDDTTEKDEPWLFLMDENGEVDKNPIKIKGIKKMTDIESVSQDSAGYVYVLSSQGLNKNGKEKFERNLFVKSRVKALSLEVEESVELRPLLVAALEKSRDPILRKMRGQIEDLLDVESHFVKDGELYIALKEPQPENSQAVVINLGSVEDVFAQNINPKVWRVLNLATPDRITNRISDMAWKGGELWVTSTSDDGVGRLWRAGSQPERIRDYLEASPEGLVFREDGGAIVVFDQASEGDGLYSEIAL